jgi:hypothetical protein
MDNRFERSRTDDRFKQSDLLFLLEHTIMSELQDNTLADRDHTETFISRDTGADTGTNSQAGNGNGQAADGAGAIPFDETLYLGPTTRATGALFNADQTIENGPAMTGEITLTLPKGEEGEGKTYRVAAWKQPSQTDGKIYLTLNIGDRNEYHYLGKMFVNEEPQYESSPHYNGFITLLPLTPGIKEEYPADAWDEAKTLRISGFRKRSAGGNPRIQLVIAPAEVDPSELNF